MVSSRKHARFSPLLVRADFYYEQGNGVCRGYVTNLSRSGAFLATRQSLSVGTKVKLLLSLPWQMGQVEVKATAVWRRGEADPSGVPSPGVGLRFDDIRCEDREKLLRYLEKFQRLAASISTTV